MGRIRRAGLALAVVVTLAAAPALVAVGPAGGATVQPGAGLSTNYDFARLVLRDGGWPVSANNVTVLTQWLRAEEPVTHWWDRDNPLNNGLGSGGGSGLGSYGSVLTAAFDVARNLEQPGYGYPLVVRDLAASDLPGTTARAIWRSSWAAGHYGFGADWAMTPVPSVAAPPTAWRSPTRCPIAYPADEVGPCGAGFSAGGPTWHSGAPGGVEGQELWAFATPSSADVASWHAAVAPGDYAVSAFLPRLFDDAEATYVVHGAGQAQRVRLDQEPYSNAWAPLGVFLAGGGGLTVTLGTRSGRAPSVTYVGADALRFVPTAAPVRAEGHAVLSPAAPLLRPTGPPQAPQAVTAVPGDGDATVSWLTPSKDGGAPVQGFVVTASPGGLSCRAGVRTTGAESCAVHGLANGVTYVFEVRAQNRAGASVRGASSPVRPLAVPTLTLTVAPTLRFGERVVYRARVTPTPPHGAVVLFAVDGKDLTGCESALVVLGHASCATRLARTGHATLFVSFSGGGPLAGAEAAAPLVVQRARTSLDASATPASVVVGGTTVLRAWGLPGHASGDVVFTAGRARLCAAPAASGAATCSPQIALAVGTYEVVATYVGSRDFARADARTTLRVLPTPPSGAS